MLSLLRLAKSGVVACCNSRRKKHCVLFSNLLVLMICKKSLNFECHNIINRLSKGPIYFSDLDSILKGALLFSEYFIFIRWSNVLRDDGPNYFHQWTKHMF